MQAGGAGGTQFGHGEHFGVGTAAHHDGCAFPETGHGSDFHVDIARGGVKAQVEHPLGREVRLVVVLVGTVREAAGAHGGRLHRQRAGQGEAAGRYGRGGKVAVLVGTGIGLVAFGEPGIREQAEVEGVGHVPLRVPEGDVAAAVGERGTAEELVGGNRAAITARTGQNSLVNGVGGRKRAVQLDAEAERQYRFVAVVRVLGGRFKADARSVHAVRHIGGVVVLERLGDVQAGARVLVRPQRAVEGVAGRCSTHPGNRNGFNAVAFAGNIQADLVAHGDILHGGNLDVGVAGLGIHGKIALGARLAHGGNGYHLVFLQRTGNGGTLRPIADGHLLAHLKVCH